MRPLVAHGAEGLSLRQPGLPGCRSWSRGQGRADGSARVSPRGQKQRPRCGASSNLLMSSAPRLLGAQGRAGLRREGATLPERAGCGGRVGMAQPASRPLAVRMAGGWVKASGGIGARPPGVGTWSHRDCSETTTGGPRGRTKRTHHSAGQVTRGARIPRIEPAEIPPTRTPPRAVPEGRGVVPAGGTATTTGGQLAAVTRHGYRRGVLRGVSASRGCSAVRGGFGPQRTVQAETRRTSWPAAGCNRPASPRWSKPSRRGGTAKTERVRRVAAPDRRGPRLPGVDTRSVCRRRGGE